jgi:hypothetical protein
MTQDDEASVEQLDIGWSPGRFNDVNAAAPGLTSVDRWSNQVMEFCGVQADGQAYWTTVVVPEPIDDSPVGDAYSSVIDAAPRAEGTVVTTKRLGDRSSYRLAAMLGSRRIAAVRRDGVDWFRITEPNDSPVLFPRSQIISLGDAVACFSSPRTNELLVVCADGQIVRVPVPQGF